MLYFLSSGRFLFLPPPRPLRCRLLDAVCCALRDHRCVLDIRYVTPILVLSSTDRRHHALVRSQKKSVSKTSLELQIIQATEWRVVRKHLWLSRTFCGYCKCWRRTIKSFDAVFAVIYKPCRETIDDCFGKLVFSDEATLHCRYSPI